MGEVLLELLLGAGVHPPASLGADHEGSEPPGAIRIQARRHPAEAYGVQGFGADQERDLELALVDGVDGAKKPDAVAALIAFAVPELQPRAQVEGVVEAGRHVLLIDAEMVDEGLGALPELEVFAEIVASTEVIEPICWNGCADMVHIEGQGLQQARRTGGEHRVVSAQLALEAR